MVYIGYNNYVRKLLLEDFLLRFFVKSKRSINRAFTLAEVLITIMIVGIISVLTVPTLQRNANMARFSTELKKVLSTLNNAGKIASSYYSYSYEDLFANDQSGKRVVLMYVKAPGKDSPGVDVSLSSIFQLTLKGVSVLNLCYESSCKNDRSKVYYSFSKEVRNNALYNYAVIAKTIGDGSGSMYAYQLADGALLYFLSSAKSAEGEYAYGWLDVNGAKGPNRSPICEKDKSPEDKNCVVASGEKYMGDVFSIKLTETGFEPWEETTRYILNSKNVNTKK